MKLTLACAVLAAASPWVLRDDAATSVAAGDAITSEVIRTDAGERVLIQRVLLDAPVADVWAAYTTDAGWQSWAAPVAKVDLKVGGTIMTHYEADKQIGDEGTNTLHIVNYVPEQLLTLQADLQPNWPEVLQRDAEHMSNVIVFDALGPDRTLVRSYGVGYRESPAYDQLMEFFISGNEGLLRKLKEVLEAAER